MADVFQFKLKPVPGAAVCEVSVRAGELGDALRCIEKIMAPDEERLDLLSNDLRGLMKILGREADAISQDLARHI